MHTVELAGTRSALDLPGETGHGGRLRPQHPRSPLCRTAQLSQDDDIFVTSLTGALLGDHLRRQVAGAIHVQ